MTPSSFLISLYSKIRKTQLGFSQYFHLLRRNRQRIRKIPLKSLISEGFWSEWGDSNARSLEPKSSAIPTSLHPDIQFLPLYHGERENQSFFCLWSFMWSKPLLYRFRQSVEIPQTQVSQGFAAFRLTLSRIPPRHSQITRAANYATFGHRYFSRPGAFFPTYVRQYTLRSAALALWHHLLLDRGQHDGFILYLSILPVSPPKSSLFASGRYVGKAVRRLWGLRTA